MLPEATMAEHPHFVATAIIDQLLHLALLLGAGLAGLAYHEFTGVPDPLALIGFGRHDTRECLTPPDDKLPVYAANDYLDRAFTCKLLCLAGGTTSYG
jgi:hypothetical protein